jgi:hypothetical protein
VIFSQRNSIIKSEKIYSYSDDFLSEIIEKLTDLKNKYLINPKNNEFNNQLKSILGKSFDEKEMESQTKQGHIDQNKFRQLKDVLATPNDQHTASGAPGHQYSQQKVDYIDVLELLKQCVDHLGLPTHLLVV